MEVAGAFWCQDIPSNHPIFNNPVLPVPGRIVIPLVIHRLGTQSRNRADLDCRIATYLNVEYEDGLAPPHWESHVGTCIVTRKDKKPLSSEHLEAVWMFIDRLMDYFGEDGPEEAHRNISKPKFERWFKGYKEGQVVNHRDEWKNVGSIYDV